MSPLELWTGIEDSSKPNTSGVSRRDFLQFLGASASLAGLGACTKMPAEKIIPFVTQSEKFVAGESQYFATATSFNGFAKQVLAKSHEGRPTKLDALKGGGDIFLQADLLDLYDSDRARDVYQSNKKSNWAEFKKLVSVETARWKAEGVHILTPGLRSPLVQDEIEKLKIQFPKLNHYVFEPLAYGQNIFGQKVRPIYHFKNAKIVLSIAGDFLGPGPMRETYAKDFMLWRDANSDEFNRLYSIEASSSLTGANADHRWPVRTSEHYALAFDLAILIGAQAGGLSGRYPWLKEIADDLRSQKSLIVVGDFADAKLQELVFVMNRHLGSTAVEYFTEKTTPGLELLLERIQKNQVDTLIIIEANPSYTAAAALAFNEALKKVRLKIRFARYRDETSLVSDWHLPASHFLESWGDALTYDGKLALIQPLISPLYLTKTVSEFLSILSGAETSAHAQLQKKYPDLEKHLLQGSISVSTDKISPQIHSGWHAASPVATIQDLEVNFLPDPTIWDGTYSNNAWLQELPKPLLQLTWSNAILMSVETAKKLSLQLGDEIELEISGRKIIGLILPTPGHADRSISLFFGYGRTAGGQAAVGHGYSAYVVQDPRSPFCAFQVKIAKRNSQKKLALTHSHWSMEGRELVVQTDFRDYKESPQSVVKRELREAPATLLADETKDQQPKSNAWAMVVNLTTCIGCNSCSIACQSENNIPVVGEEEVLRSREMHWLRIDRYYSGPSENPDTYFQPVTCMHCEKAPCEEVCPTQATNHSSDGLNQMIYNRCVGTRFCSNNCPYKVRRFNFLQYADVETESKQLMYNPDVTVRSRGVMEKCTYCVQRIQTARIKAEKENRPLKDGEIITACQQACPTSAITFGDQNDDRSRVAHLKSHPLNYNLLNELGTKPRTSYLAEVHNSNPKVTKA